MAAHVLTSILLKRNFTRRLRDKINYLILINCIKSEQWEKTMRNNVMWKINKKLKNKQNNQQMPTLYVLIVLIINNRSKTEQIAEKRLTQFGTMHYCTNFSKTDCLNIS